MIDLETLGGLRELLNERARADSRLLDEIRSEIRSIKSEVHKIQSRSVTAVSLVASDGGNNKLVFDPFYVQIVRVTDSYGKELFLDVISPTTDTDELSKKQFNPNGEPSTALGKMMHDLGVEKLSELSPMIPSGFRIRERPETVKPGWVLVYRDICEWAVLYERICYDSFATDTLIVRDGQLRSKLFSQELFVTLRQNIEKAIDRIYRKDRRRVFLVGIAKHSKVIDRYRLAIAVEGILPRGDPRYIAIPRELEAKAYVWPEYARGSDVVDEKTEAPKFVAGNMFLVRFGKENGDPIWAVDILSSQCDRAQEIFGYLLNDAISGFPVPYYPMCLQKAHQYAQIVDFDLTIFQDEIFEAIRKLLPEEKRKVMDYVKFHTDLSARRYD